MELVTHQIFGFRFGVRFGAARGRTGTPLQDDGSGRWGGPLAAPEAPAAVQSLERLAPFRGRPSGLCMLVAVGCLSVTGCADPISMGFAAFELVGGVVQVATELTGPARTDPKPVPIPPTPPAAAPIDNGAVGEKPAPAVPQFRPVGRQYRT